MAPSDNAMTSIVVLSLVALSLVACGVEAARESQFFGAAPAYSNPTGAKSARYTDSKEWYPTGTERSVENFHNANAFYDPNEGRGNGNTYGNGAAENYRTGENGYRGGAQYFSESEGEGNGYGNRGGYGSKSVNGRSGYNGGYGKGSNGGEYPNP